MELHELQQQIIDKNLNHLYIWTGEEQGIMDVYLEKISEVIGCAPIRLDSVQEAYAKMIQRRISGGCRLFVVRDDKDYLKQEKAWATINGIHMITEDYLVLIYTSMDKRSKFYKQNHESIIEFAKLPPELLAKYIQKKLPELSDSNRKQLAEICECDYNRILLECDKIQRYFNAVTLDQELNISYDDVFLKLVREGVIYKPIGDITFKLTDAVITRNLSEIARYLYQAKLKGEPEVMILSILYNGFKQVLMVQGLGSNQADAAKRTGLTPWQVKMAKEKQGHYTISELVQAIKVIRETEKSIKTGRIDSDIALEYAIVNIVG